jgi:hypothetical protein
MLTFCNCQVERHYAEYHYAECHYAECHYAKGHGVSFRCSTLAQVTGPSQKHKTMLERLARDKQSSLLREFVNYDRIKFCKIVNRCQFHQHFQFITNIKHM